MYRAYLRTFDGKIVEKTNTQSQNVARAAFAALVERADLDGQKLAAALTYCNRQLAFHRFDRAHGDADYWRGQLDEVPWPEHGGQREGAGRVGADGVTGVRRVNITLDAESDAIAKRLGDGDRSLGIRRALAIAGA